MAGFDTDTAVRPEGDGRWTVAISDDWWVVAGPNGGTVAAMVVRAMAGELGDSARTLRSLSCQYLRPPQVGAGRLDVRVERVGRSVAFLSARLIQDERPVVLALGAFGSDRESALAFSDLSIPAIPPPDELSRDPIHDGAPPFTRYFGYRRAIGPPPLSGADVAETGGWIRLAEDRDLDAPLVAQLTDAWVPAVFGRMTTPGAVPTVDLTIHIRTPIPPSARWLAGRWHTSTVAGGFLEEDGALWLPDGTLLAQSRQLAVAV